MPLDPAAYANAIDLHAPFDRTLASQSRQILLKDLANWLLQDAGLGAERLTAVDDDCRLLIKRLLTVRPARPLPLHAQQMLDDLFAEEAAGRPAIATAEMLAAAREAVSVARTVVTLWRGDITTLGVDAIVNAANTGLLGCFRPDHPCIDNAIHTAAGPRLREDCRRIIELQGHAEPTGTAKITRAYYLPSRFVLHTVGPIVSGGRVTTQHQESLASCYEACLDVAAATQGKSLAFCAISTGLFGYPKSDAASVAIKTVRLWLEQHPATFDLVVFNVFTEADEDVYRREMARSWQ
jgi:O-acetyl-ADP-ribose deacetylase (regulator of RNase III)